MVASQKEVAVVKNINANIMAINMSIKKVDLWVGDTQASTHTRISLMEYLIYLRKKLL